MRRLLPLLLAALLAVACSSPSPPHGVPVAGAPPVEGSPGTETPSEAPSEAPPSDQPSGQEPEQPPPAGQRAAGCLKAGPGLPFGRVYDPLLEVWVGSGECAVRVHADALRIDFELPLRVTPEEALAALRTRGPSRPESSVFQRGPNRVLMVEYPPGEPGEQLRVWLEGPLGPAGEQVSLGYTLERLPTPRVRAEYRQGNDRWRPLASGTTLPRAPLELRLHLEGSLEPAAVEERLGQLPWERVARPTYLLRLPEPPPHLMLDLNNLPAFEGLRTRNSLLELFFGEPPRLVALEPETGRETVIGEVPVNLEWGRLSPAGDWAALVGLTPENTWGYEVWLLETRTGRLQRPGLAYPIDGTGLFWSAVGLVVPDGGELQLWSPEEGSRRVIRTKGYSYTALSPDGRRLAGIMGVGSRDEEKRLAPVAIVLYDLLTGEHRFLANGRLKVNLPFHASPRLPMTFTPDGSALLIDEPTRERDRPYHRWRLDLAGGELTALDEPGPGPAGRETGPDGHRFEWRAAWGAVLLRSPSGEERDLGKGLPVGWGLDGRLYLIRWENAEHRRILMVP